MKFFETGVTIELVIGTRAIVLVRILGGWAVRLTDGRELARFRGPGARLRAVRYIRTEVVALRP